MGIEKFIRTVCVQEAYYWSTDDLKTDGYGSMTAGHTTISVRWEDKTEIVVGRDGKERISKAKVLVTQDVTVGGFLMLVTIPPIADIVSNPAEVGAWEIIAFVKVPMIKSTTEFVRIAYLSPQVR